MKDCFCAMNSQLIHNRTLSHLQNPFVTILFRPHSMSKLFSDHEPQYATKFSSTETKADFCRGLKLKFLVQSTLDL